MTDEQNIAAPLLVALMTHVVALQPHHVVYETGTGAGYHAAILSRLVREVYVAATDDEAKKRAREGALGRCWREYLLPFYVGSGMGPQFLAHPSHSVEKLDVDYLIEHSWFVGSPRTVTEKIAALQFATGGFGCLLIMLYDFSTEPEWWEESLRLLVEEVLPHFPD